MYVVYTQGIGGERDRTRLAEPTDETFGYAIQRAAETLRSRLAGRSPREVSYRAWIVYVPEGEPDDYDGPVCFEAHAEGWIR